MKWKKFEGKGGSKYQPSNFMYVLVRIESINEDHTLGKGCLKKITPLSRNWHPSKHNSHTEDKLTIQVMPSRTSKTSWDSIDEIKIHYYPQLGLTNLPEAFHANFDINRIKEVKKDVGFSGNWQKFLQSKKTKYYLNSEKGKDSSLLIIYGQKFYLIAPIITDS